MRRGLVLVGLAASARALTARSSSVVTRGNWRSSMRGGSVVQMSSAPREVEVQAAADFKMITEEEATVRKGAGVAIGVATAALFAGGALGYGPLSAGAFGAISTYRTGREYQ